jgi:GH24 family phage-related lysozyme (muramidase)
MEKEKLSISEKLKNKVSSLFSLGSVDAESTGVQFKTSRTALGEIFKIMVRLEEERKVRSEIENLSLKLDGLRENKRNRELIKALTGQKLKKVKPEKVIKEIPKESKGEKPPKELKKPTEVTTLPPVATKPPVTTTTPPVTTTKPPVTTTTPPVTTTKPPVATRPPAAPAPPVAAPKPPVAPTKPPAPPATPTKPPVAVSKPPIVPSIAVGTAVTAASLQKEALARISSKEGFAGKSYLDPKKGDPRKLYSVGYGHQITENEIKNGYIMAGNKKIPVLGERGKDTVISKEDAYELLKQDYPKYEENARKIPNFDKLNLQAQTALVDMTYNMGVNWYKNWPILMKQLENLQLDEASKNILSSVYATQVKGRAKENAESIKNGLKNIPIQEPRINAPNLPVDSLSKENKNLKREMNETAGNIINNINNVAQTSQSPQIDTKKVEEITPPLIRKSRQ